MPSSSLDSYAMVTSRFPPAISFTAASISFIGLVILRVTSTARMIVVSKATADIIISRIMEIRTIHRTTVQHPRQADMAPHRVLFMEVRTTVMALVMERHRITARAQDMEMLKATIRALDMEAPRATIRVMDMVVPRIISRALDTKIQRATSRTLDTEPPRTISRVQAMETRTVTMEHMEAIPVIRVMHMAAIQNRRRKRKKENRVDLENSLQNVQHLHLYLDWLQAVS